MNKAKTLNHNIATIAKGLLLIWWGTVIMVDPITIGMGAIGTGLILLGVNVIRLSNGIQTKKLTTTLGIIALIWGVLDTILSTDLWYSFALLLIVIGMAKIVLPLLYPKPKLSEAA